MAFFNPNLVAGGLENVLLLTAEGLLKRGHSVEIVLCEREGRYLDRVPKGARIVSLQRSPLWLCQLLLRISGLDTWALLKKPFFGNNPRWHSFFYFPSLIRYLIQSRPRNLLPSKPDLAIEAAFARRLGGWGTRMVIVEHSMLRVAPSRFLDPLMRRTYPLADAIVTVSDGLADNVAEIIGLPRERITRIYNPTDVDDIQQQAQAPTAHPWFDQPTLPVVLAVGRIDAQKDYATLLRAFALLRQSMAARLVILGDNPNPDGQDVLRSLQALAAELGIADDMRFPGHVDNPYAFMARGSVFVLTSRWEGLPTVLIEALACGCPVVSTDCPSGPAEILEQGRWGMLAPVGDHEAIARAVVATLQNPPDPQNLRQRASFFDTEKAVDAYEQVLGLRR